MTPSEVIRPQSQPLHACSCYHRFHRHLTPATLTATCLVLVAPQTFQAAMLSLWRKTRRDSLLPVWALVRLVSGATKTHRRSLSCLEPWPSRSPVDRRRRPSHRIVTGWVRPHPVRRVTRPAGRAHDSHISTSGQHVLLRRRLPVGGWLSAPDRSCGPPAEPAARGGYLRCGGRCGLG